jgi:hypothetical protein
MKEEFHFTDAEGKDLGETIELDVGPDRAKTLKQAAQKLPKAARGAWVRAADGWRYHFDLTWSGDEVEVRPSLPSKIRTTGDGNGP